MHRNPIILIMAVLSFSCSPDEPEGKGGKDAFSVRFDALTSVVGEGIKARWETGDLISINGYEYKAEGYGLETTFVPVGSPAPKAAQYTVVYPSNCQINGTTVSASLNSTITQSNNQSSYPPIIQVGRATGKTVVMKNALSYISVRVMSEGVKSITVEAPAGEILSGAFSVDCSSNDYALAIGSGMTSITVSAAAAAFPANSTVLLASLPRTLKSGFGVSVSFDASHGSAVWAAHTDEHTTLYRGGLLSLGELSYDFNTHTGRLETLSSDIQAVVDCTSPLSEPVSKMIFSVYSEVHGGDIVPGVCEQYMVNPSFEKWEDSGDLGESKNELMFTGSNAVSKSEDVAYPWEKRSLSGTPAFSVSNAEKFNTDYSQKIILGTGDKAVLLQRLALPMYRINKYKLRFYVKTIGGAVLKASFHEAGSREELLMSEEFVPEISAGEAWQVFEHEFTLSQSSDLFNGRHKQYNLWFELSGSGTVYIDQVTLFPSDCIEGIFNPETVAYFKQYKPQGMRWPGGNFTSGYNWKEGIGPMEQRRSLKNKAWGGINTNICGTAEFLRFCELTGIEPIMGVGYNNSILTPTEVAEWVEYCNGPASSTYGALRAADGHPEPYGVKYWGVGNEVYGTYQLGHVGSAAYATGFAGMADLMRAVDPNIILLASGQGVHNAYRKAYENWTETVYSIAGPKIDMFDCHMYVYGNTTSNNLGLSGEAWYRIFAAANLNLRGYIQGFRNKAPGKKLALLEWGVLPSIAGSANLTPQRQTFANLLISACEYNEMIRNSDVVEMAAMHNFSFHVAPQTLHSEPVNCRSNLFKELSQLSGGHCVPVDIPLSPTYNVTTSILDVGEQKGVPEIDAAAVRKGDVLYVSLVNRHPSDAYKISFVLKGATISSMSGTTYTSSMPYARNLWTNRIDCQTRPAEISATQLLSLPAMSFTILKINL